jgi:hypothetical protein
MRKFLFAIKLLALVQLSVALVPSPACAQAGDRALAVDLFEQGRALVKNGDMGGALQKFEAAAKVMHTFGILLNVAECQERLGRTASAWATWREARAVAAAAQNADDEAEATRRQGALESKLSRLTTVVAPSADVPNLAIIRDGVSLPRAAWGTATPVDPGNHVIELRAPGKIARRLEVAVGPNGETQSVTIAPLENEAVPTVAGSRPTTTTPAPEAGEPQNSGKRRRLVGWTIAGVGAVTAGIGATEALAGLAKERENHGDARGDQAVFNRLNEQYDAGKRQASLGWVLTGIGGAVAVTGAAIALTAPSATSTTADRSQISPWVGGTAAGIVWYGNW